VMFAAKWMGGAFEKDPSEVDQISQPAKQLIMKSFDGIDEVFDHHTHLGGIGAGGSGCCVHPSMRSPVLHPINYFKYHVFMTAAGVSSPETADQQYVERLVKVIKHIRPYPWGKHFLLGMDHWYDNNGIRRPELTGLYVPNEYVISTAQKYPDCFFPCVSIHPYRPDAVAEVEKYGALGVRQIKWLPNSQGMNPSDPRCEAFYAAMKRFNMVLLCHVGLEHSIDAGGVDQGLGNPLLLRGPLNAGVRVIAAHCASEGDNIDLDSPKREKRDNFDLFLRLMNDPKYRDLLFADISAMTAFKRLGKPLTTMLNRQDLHSRLVFGSDYPVPCINIVVQTKALVSHGYITEDERTLLNEIYNYNPLLFDYAVKRTLRSPDEKKQFQACVFNWNVALYGPLFPHKPEVIDESCSLERGVAPPTLIFEDFGPAELK